MKENGNEKKCMIFDFIDYLQENNAGWVEKDVVESLGQEFVKYVTEAIWYIDMCDSLVSYVLYLDNQTKIINENHILDKSIHSIADSGTTIIYNTNKFHLSDVINKYETLVNVLQELEYWILLD
ncbi:uncharacterized protein OCT59_018966 [Rhizophagus irregularis]|uniref:uncharacterized protein n=1 Tax=Rhizophagus irregularis TaxID=588596 RepID=UPI001A0DC203|nr:hypothetical protein OCT59_018966 [Rhizophagus irregularis]GBC34174.2 hypothetical protein GLOIN_2v1777486 [Rhizophagus irregularis DAOM 181602=DAOM 197198]